jgi:hypothetical protein
VEERALIIELVEGPTLAERIAQGPMAVEDALPISEVNEKRVWLTPRPALTQSRFDY